MNINSSQIKTVEKPWGKELWLALNARYCYKRIYLSQGEQTSLGFYETKKRTIYIMKGDGFVWLENNKGQIVKSKITQDNFYTIAPRQIHRIQATTPLILQEVSTPQKEQIIRLKDDYGRAVDDTSHTQKTIIESTFSQKDPYVVEKPWGKEIWLELNDDYCYKRIYINKGTKTSFQYHNFKSETNYIAEGEAEVWLEDDHGEVIKSTMVQNEFFDVTPPKKHRVIALSDIVLQECSTPEVDDVIRLSDDTNRPDGRIASEHETNTFINNPSKVTTMEKIQKEHYKKLVISPHVDDEVLGCGGVLDSDTLVFYCGIDESQVAVKNQYRIPTNERVLEVQKVSAFLGFDYIINTENAVNNYEVAKLIGQIEKLINTYKPDMIFVPFPSYNQDHQAVYLASRVALRPHDINHFVKKVLVYEQPHSVVWEEKHLPVQYFVEIDIDRKIKGYLLHESQVRKFRSPETLKALAKIRGASIGVEYAEGYKIERWVA